MIINLKTFVQIFSIIVINLIYFPKIAHAQSAIDYFQKGNFSEAIALWNIELENYSQTKDRHSEIKIRLNLTQAYNQLGLYRLANKQISESIYLAEKDNEQELIAIAYTLQGDTYQIEKKWEESIESYQKSLELLTDSEWQFATYNSLVQAYESYSEELARKAEIVEKQKKQL